MLSCEAQHAIGLFSCASLRNCIDPCKDAIKDPKFVSYTFESQADTCVPSGDILPKSCRSLLWRVVRRSTRHGAPSALPSGELCAHGEVHRATCAARVQGALPSIMTVLQKPGVFRL